MESSPRSSLIKNRMFIVLCCLVAGAAVTPIPRHLTITKTPSVDPRLFWTTEVNDSVVVEKDKYIRARVNIDFPGHECNNCLIVKRVGCAPGSRLETKGKDFYCDGSFIGTAEREDFKSFNQKLAPDQVFLIGDNKRSYDSRYFGLVNTNAIDAKLIPLF